jgi:hypothetical protein
MIQLKCSLVTKSGEIERDNVDGVGGYRTES